MREKRNVIEPGRTPQEVVAGVKQADLEQHISARAADAVFAELEQQRKTAAVKRWQPRTVSESRPRRG